MLNENNFTWHFQFTLYNIKINISKIKTNVEITSLIKTYITKFSKISYFCKVSFIKPENKMLLYFLFLRHYS